jgi:RNA 2',3'-cyclic 3'-phosphodiesterase
VRLFCAIPLDDALRARIADVPRQVEMRGYKVVAEHQMHITVRFLGATDEKLLPDIERALEQACAQHAPFDVDVVGGGYFGNPRHPNVVWLDLDDARGRLQKVYADVEKNIVALGIAPEERAYSPHLTLGRAKGRVSVNRAKLVEVPKLGVIHVDRVNLYRSQTLPSGAVHSVVVEAMLSGTGMT